VAAKLKTLPSNEQIATHNYNVGFGETALPIKPFSNSGALQSLRIRIKAHHQIAH
jgi:hypothetical protein